MCYGSHHQNKVRHQFIYTLLDNIHPNCNLCICPCGLGNSVLKSGYVSLQNISMRFFIMCIVDADYNAHTSLFFKKYQLLKIEDSVECVLWKHMYKSIKPHKYSPGRRANTVNQNKRQVNKLYLILVPITGKDCQKPLSK